MEKLKLEEQRVAREREREIERRQQAAAAPAAAGGEGRGGRGAARRFADQVRADAAAAGKNVEMK